MMFLIVSPSLSEFDAVSNDIFLQQQTLLQAGFEAKVFAELFNSTLNDKVESYNNLLCHLKNRENTLIYHHSVYWDKLEDVLKAHHGKKILRYHSITPPKFFSKRNKNTRFATNWGIAQIRQTVQKDSIDQFIATSLATRNELIAYGVNNRQIDVVAPMHRIDEFVKITPDKTKLRDFEENSFNLLFVGRLSENKGHKHLLNCIKEYVSHFDSNITLHITGDYVKADLIYMDELKNSINEFNIGANIKFIGKISYQTLRTYYSACDCFLILSEHEGFCVPLIEAQALGLAILSYQERAVFETQGTNQLSNTTIDYKWFATAINEIKNNTELRRNLVKQGLNNYNSRFTMLKITENFLGCFSPDNIKSVIPEAQKEVNCFKDSRAKIQTRSENLSSSKNNNRTKYKFKFNLTKQQRRRIMLKKTFNFRHKLYTVPYIGYILKLLVLLIRLPSVIQRIENTAKLQQDSIDSIITSYNSKK